MRGRGRGGSQRSGGTIREILRPHLAAYVQPRRRSRGSLRVEMHPDEARGRKAQPGPDVFEFVSECGP